MAVSDKLFTFDVLFALIVRDYLNKTHYRFIYEVLICKFIDQEHYFPIALIICVRSRMIKLKTLAIAETRPFTKTG